MKKLGIRTASALLVFLPVVALTIAVAGHARAAAQDSPSAEMKSLLVVSVSSYDGIAADVGFLGQLVGKPDLAEDLEKTVDMFTQGRGLAGLDKSKPWGIVVRTDGLQFQPLAFVPVTDLKRLFDVLSDFQLEAEERDDGLFELQAAVPAGPLFVKQSGGWAFLGQSPEALSQLPADPVVLLDGLPEQYDIAVRAYVQNIPEMFRQMVIGQMQAGLQQGLDEFSDPQNADAQLQQKLAETQLKSLTRLVEETNHITVGLSLDSVKHQTHLDVNLVMVAGSQLAQQALQLRDTKSAFAGFLSTDSAACVNVSSKYRAEDIEQILAMLRTVGQRVAQAIDESEEVPSAAARGALKSSLGEVMDALTATVESGATDAGMLLEVSPANLVTLAAGTRLVNAQQLEKAIKRVAELAEDDPRFPAVKWHAQEHEGVRFHTTRVPVPAGETEAREIVGEALDVVVGIGEDRLYVALGTDGLETLKAAMNRSTAAADRTVAPAVFVLSLGKVLQFAASQTDDAVVAELAKALGRSAGSDHVRITVTAIPDGFAYRIEVGEGALRALGQVLPATAGRTIGGS